MRNQRDRNHSFAPPRGLCYLGRMPILRSPFAPFLASLVLVFAACSSSTETPPARLELLVELPSGLTASSVELTARLAPRCRQCRAWTATVAARVGEVNAIRFTQAAFAGARYDVTVEGVGVRGSEDLLTVDRTEDTSATLTLERFGGQPPVVSAEPVPNTLGPLSDLAHRPESELEVRYQLQSGTFEVASVTTASPGTCDAERCRFEIPDARNADRFEASIVVVDIEGNEGQAAVSVPIDRQPPRLESRPPPAEGPEGSTVRLTTRWSEDVAILATRVGGLSVDVPDLAPGSTQVLQLAVTTGTQLVEVDVRDVAGNEATVIAGTVIALAPALVENVRVRFSPPILNFRALQILADGVDPASARTIELIGPTGRTLGIAEWTSQGVYEGAITRWPAQILPLSVRRTFIGGRADAAAVDIVEAELRPEAVVLCSEASEVLACEPREESAGPARRAIAGPRPRVRDWLAPGVVTDGSGFVTAPNGQGLVGTDGVWDGRSLQATTGAPPLDGAALAPFPPLVGVVLVGGRTDSGDVSAQVSLHETYRTNPAPEDRVLRPLLFGALPPRAWSSAAFHSGSGRLVVFGGEGQSGRLDDTWTFDGDTWSPLSVAAPPARAFHGLVEHPTTGDLVLFGGQGPDGDILGDTWLFDGQQWQRHEGAGPTARRDFVMTADGNRVVVAFGTGAAGDLTDTWSFDGTRWTRLDDNGPVSGPGHRAGWLPLEETLVLDGRGTAALWALEGNSWVELPLIPEPDTQFWTQSNIARAPDGRLWIYGGRIGSAGNSVADDTFYVFDGDGWRKVETDVQPSARWDAALGYLAANDSVVLFGGSGGSGFLNDMWSFRNGVWTELTPPGPRPPARFPRSLIPGHDGLYLVQVHTGTLQPTEDIWFYDGTRWREIALPQGMHEVGAGFGATFDEAGDRLLICGGGCTTWYALDAQGVWQVKQERVSSGGEHALFVHQGKVYRDSNRTGDVTRWVWNDVRSAWDLAGAAVLPFRRSYRYWIDDARNSVVVMKDLLRGRLQRFEMPLANQPRPAMRTEYIWAAHPDLEALPATFMWEAANADTPFRLRVWSPNQGQWRDLGIADGDTRGTFEPPSYSLRSRMDFSMEATNPAQGLDDFVQVSPGDLTVFARWVLPQEL